VAQNALSVITALTVAAPQQFMYQTPD